MATKKKTTVKKAAPKKKVATKKAAPKKKVAIKKKIVKKKTTTKKAAPKKAAPKKKVAAKKAAPKKKVAAKKAAPKKKVAAKKAAPKKKVAAKKAAPKKKVAVKKAAPKKKVASKKATTTKKASPKKKVASKKVASKKAAPKKTVESKEKTSKKVTKTTKVEKSEKIETPTPKMLKEGGKWLDSLFDKMDHKVNTKGSIKGNNMSFEIDGKGAETLVAKGNRTLDAIQTIMKSALLERHSPIRIEIDKKGHREQQTNLFGKVAKQLAKLASSARDSITIAGFNSNERKAIHQVLEGDRNVKTESDGMGAFRKLRIEPNRKSN